MDYTIVIATRNRPAALRLSIPRMLAQSRPPAQLIVVDSSDDHAATAAAVRESVGDHPVELIVRESARGLTRQRNAALELIRHPVVFFPDDDSIWFPGVAEEKMAVYEMDQEEKIAAVCAAESPNPPLDFAANKTIGYKMRKEDRLRQRIVAIRARFEKALIADPFIRVGGRFQDSFAPMPWFAAKDVVTVPWMTGFRMSFRTRAIRMVRFDEVFANYSLNEDIDASFGSWRIGAVVGARRAKVFHYKSPERRDNGYRLGVESLLNRGYVVAKHTTVSDHARKVAATYARFKTLQFWFAARDCFGKERLAGARIALKELPSILEAAQENAASVYLSAKANCENGNKCRL